MCTEQWAHTIAQRMHALEAHCWHLTIGHTFSSFPLQINAMFDFLQYRSLYSFSHSPIYLLLEWKGCNFSDSQNSIKMDIFFALGSNQFQLFCSLDRCNCAAKRCEFSAFWIDSLDFSMYVWTFQCDRRHLWHCFHWPASVSKGHDIVKINTIKSHRPNTTLTH